jgi:MFS family permease
MGVLVETGAVRIWQVFVFAVLWGTVTAIETPTRQAFISELVDRPLLPNALALAGATFNSARVIGPAIGGLSIALFGTGTAFVVNAVAYIAPLTVLFQMRPSELYRNEAVTGRVAAEDARVMDGLRYVRHRRDLLLPLGLMLVIGMVGFNFQLTLAVLAKNVFHAGAASFGLFTTALAVGALIGALAGSGRRSRPSVWKVIGAAIAFGALETAAGLMPTYVSTAVVLVPTGFFMVYMAQAGNQRVQLGVSPELRGRVMALWVLTFMGTNPIGAPLLGWLAGTFGARTSIWLGGAISLVAGVVALVARLRIGGDRIRLKLAPLPRIYVDAAPAWQGDPHGVPATARLSLRRFQPAAPAGLVEPPDRAGAELSRVDG